MYIIDAAERIALEASEVLAPYGITFQRYLEMEVAEDQLSSETRLFLEALRSIVGKAFEHACTAIDAKDKGPKPSRKLPQEG